MSNELTREELERLLAGKLPPGSEVHIQDVHILVAEDRVRIDTSGFTIVLPRDDVRKAIG